MEPPSAAKTLVRLLSMEFIPASCSKRLVHEVLSIAASGQSLSSSPLPPMRGHNLLLTRMRLRSPGQRDFDCEWN